MFKVGATIRYAEADGETPVPYEGIVLEVKEQIKISYHNTSGQTIIWVNPCQIELSDAFECTHENECGWCDGTGECIYE